MNPKLLNPDEKTAQSGYANHLVFGLFDDRTHLEGSIQDLRNHQYDPDTFSVLMPQKMMQESLSETGSLDTQTPSAVASASVGTPMSRTELNGPLNYLVGRALIDLPELGPVLTTGPLLNYFILIGWNESGSPAVVRPIKPIRDALVEFGVPETEVGYYQVALTEGSSLLLVSLQSASEVDEVKLILANANGRDISSSEIDRESSLNPIELKAKAGKIAASMEDDFSSRR